MGVQLGGIIPTQEIELIELSGKKIAIDALNFCYQFLSIIRDRMTGEPLRDSKGRITSHLSGLFYRNASLIENDICPIWVFDGPAPAFKKRTVEERKQRREEAKKKWEEALKRGIPAITYAQAAAKFTDEMIEDSKKLLDVMGIPWVEAKSEGEIQCAYMCKKGDVWASASQDYDSLLVGSPRLVRNLSITGRRKVPKKEVYIKIKPEVIELDKVLSSLEINQKQLIILGMLVGTDYAEGVKGVGPKTALKLVKEHKTLEKVLANVNWTDETDPEEIYKFFLKPPVTDSYKIEWEMPQEEKLIEFMVKEHDFSRERVDNVIEKIKKSFTEGKQSSLQSWFKK
jgi:flap endonuclease-1